jgi:hypothetical protein
MFRPPPLFFIQKQVSRYRELHQDSVPQWVFILDRAEMISFLGFCNRLRWQLPDQVLTMGEANQGKGSLWDDQQNNWDLPVSKPKKPKYKS